MNCRWVKSRITLYLYDELEDAERMELERHTERCAECAAEVGQERKLHELLDARPRPAVDPNVLAACRVRLSDALEAEPRPRPLLWARLRGLPWPGAFRPRLLQPALAALMILAAFAGGWTLANRRAQSDSLAAILQPREETSLANVSSIQAINRGAGGQIEIVYDTTRRSALRGLAADPRIERLLVLASRSYSNADIRLDSIELLKNRAGEQEIRQALIAVLRSDRNPGVRLKALAALKGMEADQAVKQALLDVLRRDDNPGIRIDAIDQLSKLRDASAVPLLQQVAIGDPNNYVRIRSASVLRELNAPEVF